MYVYMQGDMKNDKQRKVKVEQACDRRTTRKGLTSGKKTLKSSGGKNIIITERNDALSTSPRMSSEIVDCNSNKETSQGAFNKLHAVVKQEEEQIPPPAAKIKLQLFPLEENIRKGLEKDGHNPFLELTLRPRKKISSVIKHISSKWGRSCIAAGELMLFPFTVVVDNLSSSVSWTSSDVCISAGDVHKAIGSPDIFRLRYGWVSSRLNHLGSSTSLACTEAGHLGIISSSNLKNTAGPRVLTEDQNKDLNPHDVNEVTNVAIKKQASSEPHLAINEQAVVKNDDFKSSRTSNIENKTAGEEKPSAEQPNYEEPRMQNEVSLTSLLWSDLSNTSFGGLFSAASLQGRFCKPGGAKLPLQNDATVVEDSLDALFHQITRPQASTDLSHDMPVSILDAEDTCHSFAALKPSSSSDKDFLTLGRRAFSELSNQGIPPRPFKSPKSEGNVHDDMKSGNEEPKTVFNNENSLLFNLKWNDSQSGFDLSFKSR